MFLLSRTFREQKIGFTSQKHKNMYQSIFLLLFLGAMKMKNIRQQKYFNLYPTILSFHCALSFLFYFELPTRNHKFRVRTASFRTSRFGSSSTISSPCIMSNRYDSNSIVGYFVQIIWRHCSAATRIFCGERNEKCWNCIFIQQQQKIHQI